MLQPHVGLTTRQKFARAGPWEAFATMDHRSLKRTAVLWCWFSVSVELYVAHVAGHDWFCIRADATHEAGRRRHYQICLLVHTRLEPRAAAVDTPVRLSAMSTTVSAKLNLQASSQEATNSRLWDFYACGLVDENDDCSEGEDTEDELETQDWILFQRQRAQARLANACQREARVTRPAKH